MNHRSSHLAMWKWSPEWTAAVGWFAGSIDLGFESSVKHVSASKEFGQWSLGEPNFEDCGVMFSAPQNPKQKHVIFEWFGIVSESIFNHQAIEGRLYPIRTHKHHLVGGLEHGFYFPFHIWDNPSISFPLTNSYFSRWLKPPTSVNIMVNSIM